MVYGGEVAYQTGQLVAPAFPSATHGAQDMLDVKGRVGFASGSALFYGSLGWSSGTFNETTGVAEVLQAQGLNYGLGVDFKVSDNIFVGLEYTMRDLEVDEILNPSTVPTMVNSIQLRIGASF